MCSQALALGLEDPAAAQAAKAHVHAYVNAFYFGDEDLHKWIKVCIHGRLCNPEL